MPKQLMSFILIGFLVSIVQPLAVSNIPTTDDGSLSQKDVTSKTETLQTTTPITTKAPATIATTTTTTPITYTYTLTGMFCGITKKTTTGQTIWFVNYDQSFVTCKSRFLVKGNKGDLYAVFETSQQSNHPKYISLNALTNAPSAFSKGLFTSYGLGSASLATVLVRIDCETGKLISGTFLMTKDYSGDINQSASYPFYVESLSVDSNSVNLVGTGVAFSPSKNSQQNYFKYSLDSFYDTEQVISFTPDLSAIKKSYPLDDYDLEPRDGKYRILDESKESQKQKVIRKIIFSRR